MYDYDSHARPICYVYQVRRHEATSACMYVAWYIYAIRYFFSSALQHKYTFVHSRVATGAKPHANRVALNHSKDAFSLLCLSFGRMHSEINNYTQQKDWCRWYEWCVELFIYVHVCVLDWHAIIKTHYVAFPSSCLFLNAQTLAKWMNCQYKKKRHQFFL